MRIKELFASPKKNKENPLNDGTLRISCRPCESTPDYCNPKCLECIKSKIVQFGEPNRIVLEKGVEVEYAGDAVRVINSLAAIESANWDVQLVCNGKSCGNCAYSMEALRKKVWESFPDVDIDACIGHLDSFAPQGEECKICVNRSYKILGRAESSFRTAASDILKSAYKTVGV